MTSSGVWAVAALLAVRAAAQQAGPPAGDPATCTQLCVGAALEVASPEWCGCCDLDCFGARAACVDDGFCTAHCTTTRFCREFFVADAPGPTLAPGGACPAGRCARGRCAPDGAACACVGGWRGAACGERAAPLAPLAHVTPSGAAGPVRGAALGARGDVVLEAAPGVFAAGGAASVLVRVGDAPLAVGGGAGLAAVSSFVALALAPSTAELGADTLLLCAEAAPSRVVDVCLAEFDPANDRWGCTGIAVFRSDTNLCARIESVPSVDAHDPPVADADAPDAVVVAFALHADVSRAVSETDLTFAPTPPPTPASALSSPTSVLRPASSSTSPPQTASSCTDISCTECVREGACRFCAARSGPAGECRAAGGFSCSGSVVEEVTDTLACDTRTESVDDSTVPIGIAVGSALGGVVVMGIVGVVVACVVKLKSMPKRGPSQTARAADVTGAEMVSARCAKQHHYPEIFPTDVRASDDEPKYAALDDLEVDSTYANSFDVARAVAAAENTDEKYDDLDNVM